MKIHAAFPGGNIRVLSAASDCVHIAPDLRDTSIDWFYWSFCVEGAAGRTLCFRFSQKPWVGPFGAAVSHDGISWRFTDTASPDMYSFTYTFAPGEDKVFFCHDMNYPPQRFDDLVSRLGVISFPFTRSRAGREVPAVMHGEGEHWIIVTSRHHACESTGTHVLEGMLEEYVREPLLGTRLLAVPFMDMDGVVQGDPGKCRWPRDHNRDYTETNIYPEVTAMRAFAGSHRVVYALDSHSPWHRGERNDTCFQVCPSAAMSARKRRLGELLMQETQADPCAMAYDISNDVEADQEWNVEVPGNCSFSRFFSRQPGVILAQSYETAYFGTADNRITQARMVAYGRCLMRALRRLDGEVRQ